MSGLSNRPSCTLSDELRAQVTPGNLPLRDVHGALDRDNLHVSLATRNTLRLHASLEMQAAPRTMTDPLFVQAPHPGRACVVPHAPSLIARLGGAIRTKVGIALIGALVVGGGGTVVAMATAQGEPGSNGVAPRTSATSTAHSDDSSNAGKDDQDDKACTANATATGAIASPTAHSDDSSSATKVAGKDDQEASENESAQDEQNETECKSGESPEATERPEGTHTPEATKGAGGD